MALMRGGLRGCACAQEEVVLLLRRQSKGFARSAAKFRGITKHRVRRSVDPHVLNLGGHRPFNCLCSHVHAME